ncbi:MAG TPA: non-homologous end-joining DNA ligase [Nocardioidaceae bacterium]|nr:non-homologous end-joining DNA ligase [Nocardioidaceae bacterium]
MVPPSPLSTSASSSSVRVDVGGEKLKLTNLDKVLYPATGFTKGEVIDYVVAVSDPLLAALADRPLTRKRWPDGVESQPFFEKNKPRGTPDWVRTVFFAEHGDDGVDYVIADRLPTLVWLANLAALELHVPQWTVGPRGGVRSPDLLVFDLDPGPPASIVECCRVATLLRERLDVDDLRAWPKTSGNKGAQLYVPIKPAGSGRTSAYAKQLATELSREHPDLVVSTMAKGARGGKVFIDWGQNNPAKTTVAPYSLRGTERPQVSTPLSWDEVESVESAAELVFGPAQAQQRLADLGDLLAPMREVEQTLPAG